MKVALVSGSDEMMPSGIGTYVRNMRRELAALVDLRHVEIRKIEFGILGLRVGGLISPFLGANVARIPPGTDIVHAANISVVHPRADVMTLMDLIPLKTPGYPVERRLYRMYRGRIRRLKRIFTLTRYVADEAAVLFDVPRERFAPVHLGVHHEQFYPEPARPPGLSDEKTNLFYAGDLRPRKRFHVLIDAMTRLPGCRLIRAGPAPLGNASRAYAAACHDQIRRLGVDVVDVGYAPLAHLRGYYTHADLFVFPSDDEGFGLPPLEAMACGTDALVSDIPPHREVLGDHAQYFTGLDADGIAGSIREALRRPRPASALQEHARAFTWARTAAETVKVYEEVVAG